MGLLFVRERRVQLFALMLYMAAQGLFILLIFVCPQQMVRWAIFIAIVLAFQLTVRKAHKGAAISYNGTIQAEYFLPNDHFRRRTYLVQTSLGAVVFIPACFLLNIVFLEWSLTNISTSSLAIIWIVSFVSLVDLIQIFYQSFHPITSQIKQK